MLQMLLVTASADWYGLVNTVRCPLVINVV